MNCENPTPLCTTLRAIGAVGTPVHLCSIEDWGCPRLFLEDRDSNDVTHYNYLILHCTFFYFNQRFDFPHRPVATTCNLHRKYPKPFKIASLKNNSRKRRKKYFENSREIFTKILESRESKIVENSRNFSLEKSRERNPIQGVQTPLVKKVFV